MVLRSERASPSGERKHSPTLPRRIRDDSAACRPPLGNVRRRGAGHPAAMAGSEERGRRGHPGWRGRHEDMTVAAVVRSRFNRGLSRLMRRALPRQMQYFDELAYRCAVALLFEVHQRELVRRDVVQWCLVILEDVRIGARGAIHRVRTVTRIGLLRMDFGEPTIRELARELVEL